MRSLNIYVDLYGTELADRQTVRFFFIKTGRSEQYLYYKKNVNKYGGVKNRGGW